jgi:adenine phosphoribosyltransferase
MRIIPIFATAYITFSPQWKTIIKESMHDINYREYLKIHPDFPVQGIQFVDWMPVFKHPFAFNSLIDDMCGLIAQDGCLPEDAKIASIESRGFLLGVPVACRLGVPFIPVRKKGKLPGRNNISTHSSSEYESDYFLEIQDSVVNKGDSIILVDDLLATGNTIVSACTLFKKAGAGKITVRCFLDLLWVPHIDEIAALDIKSLCKIPLTI